MNKFTKDFIKRQETLDLIDQCMFTEVYAEADRYLTPDERTELTKFLRDECNIDPLRFMTTVPQYYFYNISEAKITLPEGIVSIAEEAFVDSNIATLRLPKSLKRINDESFQDCNISNVHLSYPVLDYINNVEVEAYSGAFNDDYKLWDSEGIVTKVTIPAAAKKFSHHFQDCISIKHIKFEEGITDIPHYAFSGCQFLETIELPSTLKNVGEYVFEFCNRLTTIIYNGTYAELEKINFWTDWLSDCHAEERGIKIICTDGKYTLEAGK